MWGTPQRSRRISTGWWRPGSGMRSAAAAMAARKSRAVAIRGFMLVQYIIGEFLWGGPPGPRGTSPCRWWESVVAYSKATWRSAADLKVRRITSKIYLFYRDASIFFAF